MLKKEYKVSQISSEAIFAIPSMKPAKVLVSLILCFVMIILDINFNFSSSIRSYTKDFSGYISYFISSPARIYSTISREFYTKDSLRKEIKKLTLENQKLEVINVLLDEVANENKELGSLWSLSDVDSNSFFIVKKGNISTNELTPILTVYKAIAGNTIDIDDSLISIDGILGRVISSGFYSAEVMLTHDHRSLIPVISKDSRLHGIVQGSGLNRLGAIVNIKKTSTFKVGEILYSSGLGSVFPKGFKVGVITDIYNNPDSIFLDIKVSLVKDPFNKDYFLIYDRKTSDE